jgi:hypothetical protein
MNSHSILCLSISIRDSSLIRCTVKVTISGKEVTACTYEEVKILRRYK